MCSGCFCSFTHRRRNSLPFDCFILIASRCQNDMSAESCCFSIAKISIFLFYFFFFYFLSFSSQIKMIFSFYDVFCCIPTHTYIYIYGLVALRFMCFSFSNFSQCFSFCFVLTARDLYIRKHLFAHNLSSHTYTRTKAYRHECVYSSQKFPLDNSYSFCVFN